MKIKLQMDPEDAKELFGQTLAKMIFPEHNFRVISVSWSGYGGAEVDLESGPENPPLPPTVFGRGEPRAFEEDQTPPVLPV